MNVVITGANRGIGLGFVEHYLKRGAEVWACHRTDKGGLKSIVSDRLHCLQLDTSKDFDARDMDFPPTIDLLINNAGIYGPAKCGQDLDHVTAEVMLELFNVDCVGPLRVVQQLKDRIVSAKGTIANLSSKMGSSEDNSSGGTYAYRAAKAGLVIVSKSMAVDMQSYGVQVITLHPGWVKTDMTGYTGLVDVQASVAGMTQVISRINDYPLGSFVAFDGKVIPF